MEDDHVPRAWHSLSELYTASKSQHICIPGHYCAKLQALTFENWASLELFSPKAFWYSWLTGSVRQLWLEISRDTRVEQILQHKIFSSFHETWGRSMEKQQPHQDKLHLPSHPALAMKEPMAEARDLGIYTSKAETVSADQRHVISWSVHSHPYSDVHTIQWSRTINPMK